MQDNEYHQIAEEVLLSIEEAVEASPVDIDYESASGILELTFENGTQIVINKQAPLHQIWVATRENGHHFELKGDTWIDNRTGVELWALLNEASTKQAEQPVTLKP